MNGFYPVYTKENECQDCYKCIRHCPAKAIKLRNGSASVMPECCVACGRCVKVCPAGAKQIRSDADRVKYLLEKGERLVLSLAPSWKTAFKDVSEAQMVSALKKLGFETADSLFFDTIELEADSEKVRTLALEQRLNFCYPDQNHVRISFDELSSLEETNDIIAIFAKTIGKKAVALKKIEETAAYPKNLVRTTHYLTDPVFRKYRSETALMRYIKKLERRDLSLTQSMIPLGSCTMKLNSAVTMMALSLAGFTDIHPFVPAEQRAGYTELIDRICHDLAAITGFDAVSLQPNSGANGEYSGLMVIRAYYQSKGQGYRNVVLIPASAHGTNPASAVMAGMRTVTVACDESGNIDVEDLKRQAEQYTGELCCLMITYPSDRFIWMEPT